jgi:hypothetical protein
MENVPTLPLDIFNLIVDEIYSSNGVELLKTLSIVSKELRLLSQLRIFRNFNLLSSNMERIYDETRGASQKQPPTVLSYVRHLEVEAIKASRSVAHRKYLEVLRLFTKVTSLHINNWYFQDFEQHNVTHLFGHFGATVTRLHLRESFFDSEVLISLTSLFPLVDDLLIDPRYLCDSKTYKIKDSDRSGGASFQGQLTFSHLNKLHDPFLAFVSEHCSAVHSITVCHCFGDGKLQELFDRQGGNLLDVAIRAIKALGKFIHIRRCVSLSTILTRRFPDLVSLSACTNLRALSIHLEGPFHPDNPNWEILRTTISPHLEEIRVYGFSGMEEEKSLVEWKKVDDLLCKCYHKSCATTFNLYLFPEGIELEDNFMRFIDYVAKVWPKSVEKVSIALFNQAFDWLSLSVV